LAQHRRVWRAKPVLRRLYSEQFYQRLRSNRAPGPRSLEIGSGPGFLAEIDPSIWRTDILPSPWIHAAVDAHALPFASGALDNVLGLDVLHHFEHPVHFLREAARTLRPGGRVILVEPWITPFSRLVYTYLHHEQCDLSVKPWQALGTGFSQHKRAFEGNAAIPFRLLTAGRKPLREAVPTLRLVSVERFSLFTYLLSLGFRPSCLLPEGLYPLVFRLEVMTRPLWSRLAALRALLIWEKA
jgi:SAM-dependent methyltransferase